MTPQLHLFGEADSSKRHIELRQSNFFNPYSHKTFHVHLKVRIKAVVKKIVMIQNYWIYISGKQNLSRDKITLQKHEDTFWNWTVVDNRWSNLDLSRVLAGLPSIMNFYGLHVIWIRFNLFCWQFMVNFTHKADRIIRDMNLIPSRWSPFPHLVLESSSPRVKVNIYLLRLVSLLVEFR